MEGMKMKTERMSEVSRRLQVVSTIAAIAMVGVLTMNSALGDATAQTVFGSPEQAGLALQMASREKNQKALTEILGPAWQEVLNSDDPTQDTAALELFDRKFDQMNRWVKMTDGSEVLVIGADNYAFPIPLAKNGSSRWYFDTKAGRDEIRARRIGRNELLAIDAASAIAEAERLYARHAHDGKPAGLYTTKIFSTPGKRDGLYWQVPADRPASPLGRVDLFAKDALSTPSQSPVIDGYSFRILTAQGDHAKGGAKQYIANGKMTGGFAVIATPVTYGETGIMTFIIDRQGTVYQCDLGQETANIVAATVEYNPTQEWELANPSGVSP